MSLLNYVILEYCIGMVFKGGFFTKKVNEKSSQVFKKSLNVSLYLSRRPYQQLVYHIISGRTFIMVEITAVKALSCRFH